MDENAHSQDRLAMTEELTFTAPCLYCKEKVKYRKEAGRLVLMSHGVAVLEFFCLRCRALNRQDLNPELGEQLTQYGLPTTFVRVPLEIEERAAARDQGPMTAADVARVVDASLDVFDRVLRKECGLDG